MAWAAPRQRARAAALQEAVGAVTVRIDETITEPLCWPRKSAIWWTSSAA